MRECTSVYRYRYTAVHSCTHLHYVQTAVDLRSIVPTAVGTSHFHCTKCPQLWSDKFRPWSISEGGTPESVLLYNGCYWMCTQTEFPDVLYRRVRANPLQLRRDSEMSLLTWSTEFFLSMLRYHLSMLGLRYQAYLLPGQRTCSNRPRQKKKRTSTSTQQYLSKHVNCESMSLFRHALSDMFSAPLKTCR